MRIEPYAKGGALFEAFHRYFGVDDPAVLIWRAATRTMNATVPQRVIDEAVERDPSSATAEYGGEFRTDVEAFVTREAVEACVASRVTVRAPIAGVVYFEFCDPSGGSNDAMTMAVVHPEREKIALDYIGERKAPFALPAS